MTKMDPDVAAYLGKPRTRPLAPIERAVDRATGFQRAIQEVARTIVMKCRGCCRGRTVPMYECDPVDAVLLEWACPDCQKRDPKLSATARWFNALGAEVKEGAR